MWRLRLCCPQEYTEKKLKPTQPKCTIHRSRQLDEQGNNVLLKAFLRDALTFLGHLMPQTTLWPRLSMTLQSLPYTAAQP